MPLRELDDAPHRDALAEDVLAGDALADAAADVLDHVNGRHADSLTFVARILGGVDGVTEVEAVALDARGVDLVVETSHGRRQVRIAFPEPVSDADLVGEHLLGLVTEARRRSGEPGATSAERELASTAAMRTFVTSVSAVERVHPHLVRVTLAGGDLTAFAPLGPDTFVYVLVPPPGTDRLTVGADFTWEQVAGMPEHEQPVGAYYTVRAWRPAAAELDLLFVLHEPAGPASGWAERARPGDAVALWGPRDSWDPPPDAGWYLLVVDDTGLPAVAAILEVLPDDVPVTVVAEVDGAAERQALPERDGVEVRWVHRDGAAPGSVPQRTIDAVARWSPPAGPGYAWGGGESRTVTMVRKHLRDVRGLSRDQVSMTGYWRRGTGGGAA